MAEKRLCPFDPGSLKKFGKALRYAREGFHGNGEKDLRQADLCNLSGVSVPTISATELGSTMRLNLDVYASLMAVLRHSKQADVLDPWRSPASLLAWDEEVIRECHRLGIPVERRMPWESTATIPVEVLAAMHWLADQYMRLTDVSQVALAKQLRLDPELFEQYFGRSTRVPVEKVIVKRNPLQVLIERYRQENNLTELSPSEFANHLAEDSRVDLDVIQEIIAGKPPRDLLFGDAQLLSVVLPTVNEKEFWAIEEFILHIAAIDISSTGRRRNRKEYLRAYDDCPPQINRVE